MEMESAIQHLEIPPICIADFSLVPVGTQNASFAKEIAEIQLMLLRYKVKHEMTCTGTTIEGSWHIVFHVIGHAHMLVHERGVARIQTDVRVSTRTDRDQLLQHETLSVDRILMS